DDDRPQEEDLRRPATWRPLIRRFAPPSPAGGRRERPLASLDFSRVPRHNYRLRAPAHRLAGQDPPPIPPGIDGPRPARQDGKRGARPPPRPVLETERTSNAQDQDPPGRGQ